MPHAVPALRPAYKVASAILLALALVACSAGDEGPGQGGPSAAVVTTTTVAVRPFNDRIRALGTVQARESVEVTAKVSEVVERVHFDSGDVVAAGAPLVTLSGQQQQAALAAARATADEADRMLKRQQELAAQQLIARATLDTQRATRDSALAQVRQIQANLADRTIRAPFGGVLGVRQVSPGALITPGTAIATLDDLSSVYVDFPVPEAQLANVAVGQRITGTSTAWRGRGFEGVVSNVGSRVDPDSRAFSVRADFANPERLLRPGMLVEIELERAEREALMIPEISVVQVGRDSFVYRVRPDDTVEQVTVAIGSRVSGLAEVTEGLAPGDRIVVDGTGKLRPGASIVEAAAGAEGDTGEPAGEPAVDATGG
ncbi:efflux RND transporter periplasmic adaptor subunit [Luteimonas sp. MC1750]|uniref:efflux RND transporter periplasmic adaptor subunit n=1 Tax=Luteimonas sp. MC1750 TaxID=2799326 RepID=UPI0018F0DE25|nr:efflux RND transporter periplasmic adaptor subunit [Luteimonas sp. MC1750]MBJ6983488.1 efflux RND transporter periplasmic adaptor subunit [Luteimonas sp. MC1750]QQO06337.1 efflux RND transporter periplasmic adaptor subunit [Luteimonas sp. MC1750]